MSYEKKANDKVMTLREIREFLGTADLLGVPEDQVIYAEITFGGKLKSLKVP